MNGGRGECTDLQLWCFPLKDDLGTNAHCPGKIRKTKRPLKMGRTHTNSCFITEKPSLFVFFFAFFQEDSKPRKDAGPAIVVHGLFDPADNSSGQVAR